jgi:ssDNA-binding Zn-finger/Zn-ribbon topoisomerase 1
MTEGQGEPVQLRCPRCGGLMRKPAGSTLYWHADTNHPRCDITNIVETVLEAQPTEVSGPPTASPKPRSRRSK